MDKTTSKPTGKQAGHDVWRIRRDGQGSGGFLCPPGHPNHEHVLEGFWSRDGKAVNVGARRRGNGPDYIGSIDGALGDEAERNGVPQHVRDQAARIMAAAQMTCSELWVRSVYGYFRGCYAPESGSRSVSHAIIAEGTCQCGEYCVTAAGLEKHLSEHGTYGHGALDLPASRHLAYLAVREYFPDHEPRLDLIADPGSGYGSHECVKCGQRVQYEARKDALCVVASGSRCTYNPDCPEGGAHETGAA